MRKRDYYSEPDVALDYDRWRFAGPGGQYVDRSERHAVLELLRDLPPSARILDLPTGTGRVAEALADAGWSVVVADASLPMLALTARRVSSLRGSVALDATATSFRSGSFDAVLSVRFYFHFRDVSPLLAEAHRLLKPGGTFVFDTIRWSPRAIPGPMQRWLGGRVWCAGTEAVAGMLERAGFTLAESRSLFALPSLVYRRLPAPLIRALSRIEARMPSGWLTKTFWRATKRSA